MNSNRLVKHPKAPSVEIDTCTEQVERYRVKNGVGTFDEETLLSFAFFGNDFGYANPSAKRTVGLLVKCLREMLSETKFRHVLIPTSIALHLLPHFGNGPAGLLQFLVSLSKEFRAEWKKHILEVAADYPETTFYSFDYESKYFDSG